MDKVMFELKERILAKQYSTNREDKNDCLILLEMALKANNQYLIAFSYTHLASTCICSGDNVKASEYINNVLDICEQNHYNDLLVELYALLLLIHGALDNDSLALEYFSKGLRLAIRRNDHYHKCLYYNNFGDLFLHLGSYEDALPYFELAKSERLLSSKIDNDTLGIIYLNLANCYTNLLMFDDARITLDEIKEMDNYLNSTLLLGCTLKEEIEYYYKRNEISVALSLCKEFVSKMDTFPDLVITVEMLESVLTLLIEINENDLVMKILTKMQNSTFVLNNIYRMESFYVISIKFYKQMGLNEALNETYNQFFRTFDEVKKQFSKIKIANLNNSIKLNETLKGKQIQNRALKSLSIIDELSGIYNRFYFNKILKDSFSCAINNQSKIGLVAIDIDFFKEYNDNYGHYKGDQVIISIAQLLKQSNSKNIICCRVGGDEFCVICLELDNEAIENYIKMIMQQIYSLKIKHEYSKALPYISVSIGCSNITPSMEDTSISLYDKAEEALYLSKINNRNCFTKFQEKER